MKRFAVFFLAALMTGCAGFATTQSAQTAYVQACAAYGAAFTTAVQLRIAGKLDATQISQVSFIDNQITPICIGPLPADPTAATQQITAAVTTMAVMGIAQKVSK